MKFSAIVLGSLLSTNVVMGARFTEQRRERAAKRQAARLARKSNPPLAAGTMEAAMIDNTTHPQYDTNWAGAVLVSTGFTSVTGTITVPTPKVPSGGSSSTSYSASAWVGIDGDTCQSAILQTGLDFTVRGSSVSFDAWYEWYPDYAYDFSGISIKAGDQVQMTVTATSKTTGSAVIKNLSNGQTVSHTFSGGTQGSLCETNAEWIVEDFEQGGSLVPLANFGTVTFTGASATKSGSTVGVTGSTILDMEQNGNVLTDCSTSGSNTLTCSYV